MDADELTASHHCPAINIALVDQIPVSKSILPRNWTTGPQSGNA